MSRIIHVSPAGSDHHEGARARPVLTINHAAAIAEAGDTVLVHAGTYREWVRPPRGGLSDARRITFAAAPGEAVIVKRSERLGGWRVVEGDVWKATVPNALFGDFNPFAEPVDGDWVVHNGPQSPRKHLGDVYLDGRSFYEVDTMEAVVDVPLRTEAVDRWTGQTVAVPDPEQTRYVWYAEVGADHTEIWANFHGSDPNADLVEINVRRSVFSPSEHHIDYITVRGFELAQAACPWAPPWGWWMSTRALGRVSRLPGAPEASRTAAHEAAWPTQMVDTSGWMYCIVS